MAMSPQGGLLDQCTSVDVHRRMAQLLPPEQRSEEPNANRSLVGLRSLLRYRWPGNVRELRAVIRRAVLNVTGPVMPPKIVFRPRFAVNRSLRFRGRTRKINRTACRHRTLLMSSSRHSRRGRQTSYARALEAMERYVITHVLSETDGNQSKAAEILGITRGKIRDRIARLRHFSGYQCRRRAGLRRVRADLSPSSLDGSPPGIPLLISCHDSVTSTSLLDS